VSTGAVKDTLPMTDPAQTTLKIAERAAPFRTACRVAILFALAASAALYVQYLNPAQAAFCGLNSGCETVRKSGFSYFGGTPLLSIPLVGLLAYAAVFWSWLVAPGAAGTVALTVLGGVVGAGLFGAQAFFIHAFCWLCVTVDSAAIAAAVFSLLDYRAAEENATARDPLKFIAWIALAVISAGAPAVWSRVMPAPPVPDVILALYQPGKINVVEFADFECPYCRKLHPVMRHVLSAYPAEKVHFVRKQVPLEMHEDARPAARADVCAAEQGKGEELADKLMQLDLSPSADRRAAVGIGVDVEKFDECLASKRPDAVIDADTKLLQTAGMVGLPTTYVQGKRLLGAVSEEALRDALDVAARGDSEGGIPAAFYVPLVFAVLLGIAWLGRNSRGKLEDDRRD
jgi:protein-disulfide isomerase/uncharacterized membrane protein